MDNLAHLVEAFFYLGLGAFNALLAEVDAVSEDGTSFLNALTVTAFFELDPSSLEKVVEMGEKFVLFDWFHK